MARTKAPAAPRSRTKAAPAKPARSTRAKAAPAKPARKPRVTSRSKDVDSEVAVRRPRKTDAHVAEFFNPLAEVDHAIDGIEKDYSLSGGGMDKTEERMSTSILVLDLILGGGIVGGGMYTMVGGEQSCKSTGANTMLASCVEQQVPIASMWDYEGSTQPDYLENIMRTNGIKENVESVFGLRDPKTGQWTVKPKVRYYSESVAEKFYDYLAKLLRNLPDKRRLGDAWYYVYDDTKANRALVKDYYDEAYLKKTGRLRVPAPDGKLQAIVIVDSYPAMLPEKQDVDDPGSAMAVQARMFSEQLKRVKGKLKAKRVAIIGVNQIRQKPMVMFGSPEYEPCGEALKFYSDVRLKMTSRALGAVVNGAKGTEEVEPSVNMKGNDKYRYIHVRAIKNKLSTPNQEGFLRLWIEDPAGEAHGFDPVFDTFEYLRMTGQLSGTRAKMKLNLAKLGPAKATISWIDFKRLVIGDVATKKKVCATLGYKPTNLRKFCKDQIARGTGVDMFFAAKTEKLAKTEERASKKGKATAYDDEDA